MNGDWPTPEEVHAMRYPHEAEIAVLKRRNEELERIAQELLRHNHHNDTHEMCPTDDVPDARDPLCPACRALLKAEALLTGDGAKIRSPLDEMGAWEEDDTFPEDNAPGAQRELLDALSDLLDKEDE